MVERKEKQERWLETGAEPKERMKSGAFSKLLSYSVFQCLSEGRLLGIRSVTPTHLSLSLFLSTPRNEREESIILFSTT